jgi:hypothetical protein
LGLAGCVATTTMNSAQPDTQLRLKSSSATSVPRTEKLTTTSFGNYEFYATSPGLEPFSGILPLKFNGGYLALDILFFAPAMFFNLREPYALYEVDVAQRVVRYKKKAGDPWHDYLPSSAEAARGAKHFHE